MPDVLGCGVLIFLQASVSHYIAAAIFGPGVLLAIIKIALPKSRKQGGLLLLTFMFAIGLILLFFAPHFYLRSIDPDMSSRTAWSAARAFFQSRLPGYFWVTGSPLAIPYPAAALILVGVIFAWTCRDKHARPLPQVWRTALWWTGIGFLASLSPRIFVFGKSVRLPYYWINEWIPLWEVVRVTQRLGIAALVGICMLAGLAFAATVNWMGGIRGLEDDSPRGHARRGASRQLISGPLSLLCLILVTSYLGSTEMVWRPTRDS